MRIPFDLPEHHQADFEELVYQLRGYGADHTADQLFWERTSDGWALRGPWAPQPNGYQRVGIKADKYAALQEVCGVADKVFLHRLIAAMMGPVEHGSCIDTSAPTVHHVDGDILNQAPANLEAGVTRRENAGHHPIKGFCISGHPIIGANAKNKGSAKQHLSCRFCDIQTQRLLNYKSGRTKTLNPMPEFHVWVIAQHATKQDLAMLKEKGIPMPGVAA